MRATPREAVRPTSLPELQALVAARSPSGTRVPVTVRAGGNFFHSQALGDSTRLVVLDQMPHEVHVTRGDDIADGNPDVLRWNTVEATAWTPWEAILRATLRIGAPSGWSSEGARTTWSVEA